MLHLALQPHFYVCFDESQSRQTPVTCAFEMQQVYGTLFGTCHVLGMTPWPIAT